MNIVFATTCRGRAQHLKLTLPQNLKGNLKAKFVVLDYGIDYDLCLWLTGTFPKEIESGRLSIYSYPAARFAMAHAKNMAHRCAILEGADVICNADADNFLGRNFDLFLRDVFSTCTTDTAMYGSAGAFMWARMVKGKMRRGVSGRIAMTKRDFILTGGYDEAYADWGPDDKDMNVRLERLGRVPLEIPERFLDAIHHKDKLRFKEYPHARPDPGTSAEQFYPGHDCTVANGGNIGCGTVFRNYDPFQCKVLAPLPTRIFGIGNQKTATQALDHALRILGYDSAHWLSGGWARDIMLEMRNHGRSRTLEQHYALSDLPIAFLYRELDKAYPGSKFILTTRPDADWLESARKHWSYEHNVFRKDWDKWPASNLIHKAMYGRTDFDAETFLTRYRWHNAMVQQYFRSRPNDLLVLPMEQGSLWEKLCGFLGHPVPMVPYPFVDRTLPGGK